MSGLDAFDDEKVFTLVSLDGREFEIDEKSAVLSNLIKTISEQDKDTTRFELKVDGDILQRIIEYLKYHKGKAPEYEIPKPLRSSDFSKAVSDPFDVKFFEKVPRKPLFDTILAANYMDIQPLLHLGCAKTASYIRNMSPDEIRQVFNRPEEPWEV